LAGIYRSKEDIKNKYILDFHFFFLACYLLPYCKSRYDRQTPVLKSRGFEKLLDSFLI